MPSVPVVMISGHGTIETAVEAIKIGAYDFIEKPFKADRLLLVVARAIEAAQLRRENAELKLRAGGELDLVGASSAINQLRQQIERVAPTGSRVLVTGAPGSGKEVVGRLLHARSRRAEGPFVAVNCATMRPDRLEIELFGSRSQQRRRAAQDRHVRAGAWRHLVSRRSRRHAARDPGQDRARLAGADLRAGRGLAPRRGRCAGASPRRTASWRARSPPAGSARICSIASTSCRSGCRRCASGARTSRCWRGISWRAAPRRRGIDAREFGEDALAALQAYTWPGNVRQLRNVIDWLLIMAPGDTAEPVRADMLPNEITAIAPTVVKWDKGSEIMTLPLRDAREVFEREYLLAQVTRFGGNISRTAAFVGMERSALHRKLKSLGVFGNERPLKVGT